MKQRIKVAAGIFSLALIFVLLVSSIDFHAFNKNYYREQYTNLNTAESLGMSDEDLFAATDALLDYLHDDREDILVEGEVFGFKREIFTERETLHMVDVKNLYQNVLTARNVATIIGVLALIYLIIFSRKEENGLNMLKKQLAGSFIQISICLLIAVGLLAGYALMDFTSFWIGFHELFFTNDLWQLNPANSIMINMFPEIFFAGMVFRITATFVVVYILLLLGFIYLRKKAKEVIDKKM